MKKILYEDVKKYLNKYNIDLLTTKEDYKGVRFPLTLKCSCKNIWQTKLGHFKNSIYKSCPSCSISKTKKDKPYRKYDIHYVRSIVKGSTILSKDYTHSRDKITLQCQCGVVFKRDFSYLQNLHKENKEVYCNSCNMRIRLLKKQNNMSTIVNEVCENKGFKVLSEYVSAEIPLKIQCMKCEEIYYQPYRSIQPKKQKYCYICNHLQSNLEKREKSIQEIVEYVESTDNKVLKINVATTPIEMTLQCKCSKVYDVNIYNFNKRINKTCPSCSNNTSNFENEIVDYIKTVNPTLEVIQQDRKTLEGRELDILIPSRNLAIECDGLYWHSELRGKSHKYHLDKTLMCSEKNIQLIHIFENEWSDKQEIVKSIISNLLNVSERIYARKCFIQEVSKRDAKLFLECNHLQGYSPSTLNVALFYNDEIVSLMTFGKSRYDKKVEWEMIRFCNKLNLSVVGGASRLFKEGLKILKGSIISYSDRRYFNGELYRQLGFYKIKNSTPNYFYFNEERKLKSRQTFQKHKLKGLLEYFNPELTEWENMKNNGYNRIWDCGNSVWLYDNKLNERN